MICGGNLRLHTRFLFSFQVMLQYLDKLQKEDMENLVKKREIQRALMKDVAKANEVSFLTLHKFQWS